MPRDAIKIRTSVQQGYVVAGRPFSLTTSITNPYDDSIDVITFHYHIPFQVQWIHDQTFDAQFKKNQELAWYKRFFSKTPLKASASPPGQVMLYGVLEGPDVGSPVFRIAAGEAQSHTFRAIIPQWLFLTGGQLVFQGTVTYKIAAEQHTAVFEVTVPFRPPLKATSLGAVIGAMLGSCAKILTSSAAVSNVQMSEAITATLLSVILATIGVVFSSRRANEVQPVLTVEDVWGGMILGFLVGYLGNTFFQKILPFR